MKSLMQTFKEDLEVVLDEGFPKIFEEGPEKIANKRGPALQIFAEAVIRVQKIITAFGGCETCYGKGYSTQKVVRNMQPVTQINYCFCERGTQLESLIGEKI